MKFTGNHLESLEVVQIDATQGDLLNRSKDSELSLLWFESTDNQITIDNIDYTIGKNELISFTEYHNIEIKQLQSARLIRWNRPFYCVVDHDSEVGCKGILYYGSPHIPIIKAPEETVKILQTVYEMLLIEMQLQDNLQLEMLQMMLKRLLILCTRIYKQQHDTAMLSAKHIDIIRDYSFLVEQHFKTKHNVKAYADILFKSPKTLSNIFKKHTTTTPLQYIHNRIMLEAKRELLYTDRTISEISYNLGYEDVQSFSRFFKKHEGLSPQKFKKKEKLTT